MRRIGCWACIPFVAVWAGCQHGKTLESTANPEPPPSAAQAVAEVQPPPPPEGWAPAAPPRRFVGADLFNHIDGAAEVFLELGFRRVLVQGYDRGDTTLDVQIYEMENSTAARAMFLRLRGKGVAVPGVTGRNVGNRYQITAQHSRFFVQVNNPEGDEGDTPEMVELASRTLQSLPADEEVGILAVLPDEGKVPGSESIVRGPYTLQSICTLGEGDILQMNGQVFGVAADYETKADGRFTRLIIPYPDANAARAAFANLRSHLDPELRPVRHDARSIVFQDYRNQFGDATIRGNTIDIRVGLSRDPSPE
ncbi:MAG: hypothetical protein JXB13_04365 [Phycisphaerae bacterium]|nr:hypothetical protein [Phycisphaerae bacterium]